MSFYFNGTQANVTISGAISTALPTLGTGQTLKTVTASNQASAVTLFTVTTGKTFYCLGFSVGSTSAQRVGFSVSGTRAVEFPVTTAGSQSVGGNGIIFTAASTQTVQTYASSNVEWYGTIWGYEA